MYVPAHFEETRSDELHRIIGQHPLEACDQWADRTRCIGTAGRLA